MLKNCIGVALLFLLLAGLVALPYTAFKQTKHIDLVENIGNHNLLYVFFGFPDCSDRCPLTLATLSQLEQKAQQTLPAHQQPGVLFINIDPLSNLQQSLQYARQFNAHFYATTLAESQLAGLEADIVINSTSPKDLSNTEEVMGIEHAGRTYLLIKKENSGTTSQAWSLLKTYNSKNTSLKRLYQDLQSI